MRERLKRLARGGAGFDRHEGDFGARRRLRVHYAVADINAIRRRDAKTTARRQQALRMRLMILHILSADYDRDEIPQPVAF